MADPRVCDDRARALARANGIDTRDYVEDFERREAFLLDSRDADELVLWFESDSFCELHLIDLLGRSSAWPELAVSVVHPPELSLAPDELRAWFDRRVPASLECRSEARRLWSRYCDEDPREFAGAEVRDPLLASFIPSVQADFVARFPDARGLSRFDELMLERLRSGPASPLELFELSRSEPTLARLGLGDLQVWARIEDLDDRGLIELREPLPKLHETPGNLRAPTIAATELGCSALAGERIATAPRGPIAGADPTQWLREASGLVRR